MGSRTMQFRNNLNQMRRSTLIGMRCDGRRTSLVTRAVIVLVPLLILPACATRTKTSAPAAKRGSILETREGLASYYGPGFDGKVTASGTRFNQNALIAAHPSYPFGTVLRVTNVINGKAVEVRVVDRGPASGPRAEGVIIDVSYKAADTLNFIRSGRARVRVEVLRWGAS